MTQVQQFSSLDEIAFDTLYAASLPYMEAGTFYWPEGITDRKAFVADRFRDILAHAGGLGIWIVAPDRFVMVGHGEGSDFTMLLALMAPDENGSRAYTYDPSLVQAYVDFFKAKGFTHGYSQLSPGSSLIDAAKMTFKATDMELSPLDNEVRVRVW